MKTFSQQNIFDGSYQNAAYSGSLKPASPEEDLVAGVIEDYNELSFAESGPANISTQHESIGLTSPQSQNHFNESLSRNITQEEVEEVSVDGRILPLSQRNFSGRKGVSVARSSFADVEWECVVEDIGIKTFSARMLNLTNGSSEPEDVGEFHLADLSADERLNLKIGSVFRWFIGEERVNIRQKRKISEFYFRPELKNEKTGTDIRQLLDEIRFID